MEELSTPTMRERLNLALQAKKITPKPGPRGDGFEVELIEEDGDDKMLVDVDDLTPYGEEWTLTLRIAVGVDDGEAAERAAQLVERMTSAEEWKADRDLFEDGSNAVDLIWSALDAAGVQDGVDTREMVQVSEDEADVSTFEPMSEEEIRGWLGSVHSGVERLAKTALHHLAHAKATEEARGALADRIETLQDELSRSRAFSRGLSANVVAAEEARDLAIAERDEAYRQRDELGREGDTAHALLNGSIGSRVVPRKGETALVSQARTAAEVVADLRLQLRAIVDDRDALVAQVAALEARIVRMAKTLHEEADTGEAYARQMSFEPLSTAAMRRVVYLRAVADGGAS